MSNLYLGGVLFDSSITNAGIIINLAAFILFGLSLVETKRKKKNLISLFMTIIGVASFELITGALWKVQHLGSRAYSFRDISWVLTLLWSSILYMMDLLLGGKDNKSHITKIVIISLLYMIVVGYANVSGIITYEPEAQESIIAMIGKVPVNVLYYIPLWAFYTYSFKKYFDTWLFEKYSGTFTKLNFKNILTTVLIVLGFQLLLEPVVQYQNLPQWGFMYNDIHILITLARVLLFALINFFTSTVLKKLDLFARFGYAILLGTIGGSVFHGYLIKHDILSFSLSALQTHTPNSIALGDTGLTSMTFVSTMIFVALMIAAIKSWTKNTK